MTPQHGNDLGTEQITAGIEGGCGCTIGDPLINSPKNRQEVEGILRHILKGVLPHLAAVTAYQAVPVVVGADGVTLINDRCIVRQVNHHRTIGGLQIHFQPQLGICISQNCKLGGDHRSSGKGQCITVFIREAELHSGMPFGNHTVQKTVGIGSSDGNRLQHLGIVVQLTLQHGCTFVGNFLIQGNGNRDGTFRASRFHL